MTSLHEMADMAEAMKKVGDTPPTREEVEGSIHKSEEVPKAEEANKPSEDLSGGLGETLETETVPQVSIDDILGLTEDRDNTVGAEKKVETKTKEEAEEKPAGDKEPESALAERVRELSDRLNRSEESNLLLTKKLLGDNESGEEEPKEKPKLDQDMSDYFTPYAKAATAEETIRLNKLEKAVAPILKEQEDIALAREIARYVPSFKVDHFPKMEAAYTAASEAEQGLFKGSIAGAIMLAQKLEKEGSFGQPNQNKKQSNSALARQHTTEHGGSNAEHSRSVGDEEKAQRIMNMDPSKVLEILEKLEQGG